MPLDNDLLDPRLEGLLVPDVARPLLEDVRRLRDRLAGMEQQLAGAEARAGGPAEAPAALRARPEEATRRAAELEAERAHHLGQPFAAADGDAGRASRPTARG